MKVLVTGWTGFLGKHLCHALGEREDFVVGLQRDNLWLSSDMREPDVIISGSFEQVERAIAEYEIDAVVHLAAQTQVSTAVADPIGTFETNARGTWQVLEACRRQKVKRVIVASSDKAYGSWVMPYSESQPLVANGIYATSKLITDSLAQAYLNEYKLSVAITRCGNLYGPGHTNWSTLIPGAIKSAIKGERFKLRSSGGPRRDFLYVEDAVDGYVKLLDSGETGPFNFGTGTGVRVSEVVGEIYHLIGKRDLKPILGNDEGAVEIIDQIVDASKARERLGWQPATNLYDGLRKTIEWYEDYLREEL